MSFKIAYADSISIKDCLERLTRLETLQSNNLVLEKAVQTSLPQEYHENLRKSI